MIAAIHQPNYLPWLGVFYKMAVSDVFVFLDNVQYTKEGFVNRNRIKTPQGAQWLTVDVLTKGRLEQQILDVEINNQVAWAKNHWKTISMNYSRVPHFSDYKTELESVYLQRWDKLADLNLTLARLMCGMLGLTEIRFVRASGLGVSGESTALLVDICRKVGADTYLSGFSGAKYMDESLFDQENIKVVHYDFHHPVYRQQWGEFIPNLSIIDLLFNEGENSLNILKGSKS